MKNEIKRVEVKSNSLYTKQEACTWCGNPADTSMPFAYFVYGSHDAVCEDCAMKHNPDSQRTFTAANALAVMIADRDGTVKNRSLGF